MEILTVEGLYEGLQHIHHVAVTNIDTLTKIFGEPTKGLGKDTWSWHVSVKVSDECTLDVGVSHLGEYWGMSNSTQIFCSEAEDLPIETNKMFDYIRSLLE
jgi:hypothetical protein